LNSPSLLFVTFFMFFLKLREHTHFREAAVNALIEFNVAGYFFNFIE
jgi:hypothetical protein